MVGVAFPTTGGYGNGLINTDGSALVDTEDGTAITAPQFYPNVATVTSGSTAPATTDPAPLNPWISVEPGLPPLNALLVEIRVLNALLILQLGDKAPDLEQMRADEAYVTSIVTGSI